MLGLHYFPQVLKEVQAHVAYLPEGREELLYAIVPSLDALDMRATHDALGDRDGDALDLPQIGVPEVGGGSVVLLVRLHPHQGARIDQPLVPPLYGELVVVIPGDDEIILVQLVHQAVRLSLVGGSGVWLLP